MRIVRLSNCEGLMIGSFVVEILVKRWSISWLKVGEAAEVGLKVSA